MYAALAVTVRFFPAVTTATSLPYRPLNVGPTSFAPFRL